MKSQSENKLIVLRVGEFPKLSETFIIEQAIMILELGYELKIVVNKKNEFSPFTESDLIHQYELFQKTEVLGRYIPNQLGARILEIIKKIIANSDRRALGLLNPFRFGTKAVYGGYFLDYQRFREIIFGKIVHVEFGYNITTIDKIKALNLFDVKLIVTFHGADAHLNGLTKSEKINYYNLLFQVGDYFTCNTSYLKAKLIELGCPKEKLEVVHVPVDTDRFVMRNSKSGQGISILSVGRLIKLKGYDYGIKVVKNLLEKGVVVTYNIVGDGPERARLELLTSELGVEAYVNFLGAQPQYEVLKQMQGSMVFLMTSTVDSTGRREAQGVVTIEAQSCGVPVVAFDCGGVASTIVDGETGFLCPEGNVDYMTEKVMKLINDSDLRNKMGIAARKFVEKKFSKSVIKEKWRRIYSEVGFSKKT